MAISRTKSIHAKYRRIGPTGYLALNTHYPYDPQKAPSKGEIFEANAKLRDWAFDLTKDIKPPDLPDLAGERAKFKGFPNAQKPPSVQKGDTLSAMTYWHGALMNEWANRWVSYWSDGKGEFVTSAMEDTGVMQALTYLNAAAAPIIHARWCCAPSAIIPFRRRARRRPSICSRRRRAIPACALRWRRCMRSDQRSSMN